ncbi:MAG TPA: glycine oxidase ThiO [Vicinamibacterales bacterium]|nr:glycine oxidase ThiO [Vicinamibacterales bacterium]
MRPDVLIIGAGIIGCSAAEALTRRGARVGIIDSRGVAGGATQASAGMLVPFSEGSHDAVLASLGARSLSLFEDLAARVANGSDSPPLFVRTGSLEAAMSEEEAGELRSRAAAIAAEGVPARFLTGDEARAIEPRLTSACVGALHVASHAFTPAAELTRALWNAASRAGASFIDARVQRVEGGSSEVRVLTSKDALAAPVVVLAGGSWAGLVDLSPVPALPVRPIRGQILQLAWEGPPLASILWSSRCYTLTWADGTMLAGATVEDVGYDERATVAGVRDLLDGLCELVPSARDARFARVRVGLRPQSPDGRPIIGRSVRMPGLVYATGHYRNGVLLAPLTGELVAKAVAGEDDEAFAVVSPERLGEY